VQFWCTPVLSGGESFHGLVLGALGFFFGDRDEVLSGCVSVDFVDHVVDPMGREVRQGSVGQFFLEGDQLLV